MELKQLASFEAVIKYESFTHAAEKLFLSQPTVSAHVQQLEKELGVRLIDRTTKVVTMSAVFSIIEKTSCPERLCSEMKLSSDKIGRAHV